MNVAWAYFGVELRAWAGAEGPQNRRSTQEKRNHWEIINNMQKHKRALCNEGEEARYILIQSR